MAKRKYTFEMWLNGTRFDKDGVVRFDDPLDPIIYSPKSLYESGELPFSVLSEIEAKQSEIFGLIIEDQTEAHLIGFKRRIEQLQLDDFTRKTMIDERSDKLSSDHRTIFDKIIRKDYPPIEYLTGPDYLRLQTDAQARHDYFSRQSEALKGSDDVLSKFLTVAQLKGERSVLSSNGYASDDQKPLHSQPGLPSDLYETMFERYWGLKDDGGALNEEAFEQVRDWLLNELGLTEAEVKKRTKVGITVLSLASFSRTATNYKTRKLKKKSE